MDRKNKGRPGWKWAAARIFWLALGWCALAAGAIGAVLPVLPTTPFVILAAFAFGKASPRLQAWLERSRQFGPIIADWRANGAIAPRYKIISHVMMAAVFALSLWLSVPTWALTLQALCLLAASAFILSRPNPKPFVAPEKKESLAPPTRRGWTPDQVGDDAG
jgi:uncharacterized protein